MEKYQYFFSIVIPVYKGSEFIEKLVLNILSQGLNAQNFEIIFVDDVSPDNTVLVIKNAMKLYKEVNIRLIEHRINKRQGGGRNSGIKEASGKYIIFIDQDDIFENGALLQVQTELQQNMEQLDVLMYDFEIKEKRESRAMLYIQNHQETVVGKEFFKVNAIPSVPWCCAYKTEFLKRENLYFEENVLIEDADWVISVMLAAKRVKYSPILVYHYAINNFSTTNLNSDDILKLNDYLAMSRRIRKIHDKCKDRNITSILRGHYLYRYRTYSYRLIHLHSFKEKLMLVSKFFKKQFTLKDGAYLFFMSSFPVFYTCVLHICSPLLSAYVRKRNS